MNLGIPPPPGVAMPPPPGTSTSLCAVSMNHEIWGCVFFFLGTVLSHTVCCALQVLALLCTPPWILWPLLCHLLWPWGLQARCIIHPRILCVWVPMPVATEAPRLRNLLHCTDMYRREEVSAFLPVPHPDFWSLFISVTFYGLGEVVVVFLLLEKSISKLIIAQLNDRTYLVCNAFIFGTWGFRMQKR